MAQDVLMSHLGLVSDKILNVSVSKQYVSVSAHWVSSRAIASHQDDLCRHAPCI